MLSHDLNNLAAALQMGLDGNSLNERSLREVVRQLRQCATDATQLEAASVAPDSADLPSNVVSIARKLDRQGVRLGVVGGPDGGDAA